MTLRIDAKRLQDALTVARSTVPSKCSLPALTAVRLTASNGTALIQGTDLYVEVMIALADVDGALPTIAIDAEPARKIASKLDGEVKIEAGGKLGEVKIASGARKISLTCPVRVADLPVLSNPCDDVFATLTGAEYERLIGRVSPFVSTDETRTHLSGVYLEVCDSGVLRAVTTDGHRLAKSDVSPCYGVPKAVAARVIPVGAFRSIDKALAVLGGRNRGSARVTFGVQANRFYVCAVIGDVTVTTSTKLPDVRFPPYEKVIPAFYGLVTTVSKAALSDAIDLVAAVTDECGAILVFDPEVGLTVSTQNTDGGECSETIDGAVTVGDGAVKLGVNYKYLKDALKFVETEWVVIRSNDPLDPIGVEALCDDPDWINVTMPLRV